MKAAVFLLIALYAWSPSTAAIRKEPDPPNIPKLESAIRASKTELTIRRTQLLTMRKIWKIEDRDPESLSVIEPKPARLEDVQRYLEEKILFLQAKAKLKRLQVALEFALEREVGEGK